MAEAEAGKGRRTIFEMSRWNFVHGPSSRMGNALGFWQKAGGFPRVITGGACRKAVGLLREIMLVGWWLRHQDPQRFWKPLRRTPMRCSPGRDYESEYTGLQFSYLKFATYWCPGDLDPETGLCRLPLCFLQFALNTCSGLPFHILGWLASYGHVALKRRATIGTAFAAFWTRRTRTFCNRR